MNPLKEVLTLSEAAYLKGITPNALRLRLNRLAKEGKINSNEAIKAASPKGEWKIMRSFLDQLYN